MSENRPHYDKERILEVVAIPEIAGQLGIELKRCGNAWLAVCPFHVERSASFNVRHVQGKGWRFHCFGCGKDGDAIDLWREIRNVSFPDALAELAGLYGIGGARVHPSPMKESPKKKGLGRSLAPPKVIKLPPMARLSGDTMRELAELRGVSVEGVRAACEAGLIWGQLLAVSDRLGMVWGERMEREGEAGRLRIPPVRCWLVSDGQHCAEARRLDGKPWSTYDGREFKSYTIGTKKWPVGVAVMGDAPAVAIVEGGPDVLAAFHFMTVAGAAGIAVIAVLGAASSVPPEVWPMFKGRRVRLFPHFDKIDEKSGERTGWRGAEKWQESLAAAGAEADCFFFGTDDPEIPPLMRADGKPVKDLNDAALGDAECVQAVTECFRDKRWVGGARGLTLRPWWGGA